MARKLAHDPESGSTERESNGVGPPEEQSTESSTFERRGYVRLGAAVVATVLSLGGSVTAAVATETERDDKEHHLRISGTGTASTYELTVDGELVPGEDSSSDAAARISECTAEGAITTGDRRYRFSGELRDLQVDGDAAVVLDGVDVR